MPAQHPRIYLFDIDGTLVSSGGVGRRALESAFALRYGNPGAFNFPFDGMTDRAIVSMALRDLGLTLGEHDLQAEIDAVLDDYVLALAGETQKSAHAFVVHEGAPEVLDALQAGGAQSRGVIGLGTGNIRKGAAIKLGAVGLYDRFTFGGFGCDHHDRAQLLAVGAARGAALLGRGVNECEVVVIGDTPKDVAAARAIGATSLAVATGRYSQSELRACGADHTAASLASPEALQVLLPA